MRREGVGARGRAVSIFSPWKWNGLVWSIFWGRIHAEARDAGRDWEEKGAKKRGKPRILRIERIRLGNHEGEKDAKGELRLLENLCRGPDFLAGKARRGDMTLWRRFFCYRKEL